jgi:hypothetical protein
MSVVQQKANTVLQFAKLDSFVRVQDEIRRECGVRLPDDKNIRTWREHYRELGGFAKKKKKILLGVLEDLMKMWIVLARPPYGVRSCESPEQVQRYKCHKRLFTEFF